eukprot:TRINITY_DN26940_c0_g1_i1.p3 TRINITY_DN26940_c0_g1~~TRINITY_DN26940_c0_g1_i1.p3  ORF type:complete len:112 (-),score=5.46 TRINITY_DN26940_c0_g1_i1:482-817(-)
MRFFVVRNIISLYIPYFGGFLFVLLSSLFLFLTRKVIRGCEGDSHEHFTMGASLRPIEEGFSFRFLERILVDSLLPLVPFVCFPLASIIACGTASASSLLSSTVVKLTLPA